MTDLPAPLTPADCDLRDFQFMPIDIVRLFGSRFHAIASDAEWRAGITLWLKSFHQAPSASVPDDDIELARLAEFGRDLKSWKKVREVALYGWIKCSDGRFYHPVVAEKALEAWKKKEFYRERSKKANASRWGGMDRAGEPEGGEAKQKDNNSRARRNEQGNQEASNKESFKHSNKESFKHSTKQSLDDPSASQGTVKGQKEEDTPSAPLRLVGGEDGKQYAFEGRTIRLNQRDFDQWGQSYHAIPDLTAELQALDDWLQGDNVPQAKRDKWFNGVSGMLRRKHEERLTAQTEEDAARASFLARYPEQVRTESDWRALLGDEEFEQKKHRLKIQEVAGG